jgi:predicted DCC family thiol-disulfide oxidoreductase YuxK
MGSPHSLEEKNNRSIILFDGVCNLCNRSVQFIIKRDPSGKFSFASLQSRTGKQLMNRFEGDAEDIYSILLIKNGILFDRSDALLEIAKDLNGAWPAFRVFRFLPKVFRDSLYKLIANNRYRLFGKQDSCLLPTADLRARFID